MKWFNPRTGCKLMNGPVKSVKGGGGVSLGPTTTDPEQDWLVLVR